ncbi:right-handed parallel beta-helix repeat-containing protein [bacterium]|nr:right-handed parallel beta-helix repeat-containing protein [bacterium]
MQNKQIHSTFVFQLAITLMVLIGLSSANVFANHPVLVEVNNCSDFGPGSTLVPPGTCGDYDGDGRIGTAEDADNATDRIFGTITAALGSANGGANQNGRVTVITSGRFPEQVVISAATGNVTLEAAPGVEANIDAVLAGDANNNNARQGQPGIVINAASNRRVVLRNLVSRNWKEGITIVGNSRVSIDNCRVENNTNYGIRVMDAARVAITNTQVNSTGFRAGATGDFPVNNNPNPGNGIEFENSSRGTIAFSVVTHSFRAGVSKDAGASLSLVSVILFGNNPNKTGL